MQVRPYWRVTRGPVGSHTGPRWIFPPSGWAPPPLCRRSPRRCSRCGWRSIRAPPTWPRRCTASDCSAKQGLRLGRALVRRARPARLQPAISALASLLGLRTIAGSVAAGIGGAVQRLLSVYGRAARWAAVGSRRGGRGRWIGRLAFALGVAFALGAVLALVHARAGGRPCSRRLSAASPAAGALLALAALTDAVSVRARRPLLFWGPGGRGRRVAGAAVPRRRLRALPAALVPRHGPGRRHVPLALPPGSGRYAPGGRLPARLPRMPCRSARRWAATSSATGCCWPGRCCCVRSPRGLSAEQRRGARGQRPRRARTPAVGTPGLTPAAAVALCAWAVWVGWGPVRETVAVAGSESTSAAYYAPVERFLASPRGDPCGWRYRSRARAGRPRCSRRRSRSPAAGRSSSMPLRRGPALARADGRGLSPLAARAGGRLRRAARRRARSLQRDGGSLIRAGLPYLSEVFASRALAALRGARRRRGSQRSRADDGARVAPVLAARLLRAAASPCASTSPATDVHARRRLRGTAPQGVDPGASPAPGDARRTGALLAGRALGLGGSCATDGAR